MKKNIYTATAISLLSLGLQAQIKVWTGGGVGIGYTAAAPTSGYKMQVSGNSLFSSATGSTSSSAAMIRGNNGYSPATAPDYTWNGDNGTGIYHDTATAIGFSIAGSKRLYLKGSALTFAGWTNAVLDFSGSGSIPCLHPSGAGGLQLGTSTLYLGDCYMNHELYRVAATMFSDKNVKNNINYKLDNTLAKLKKLKPVSYNLKPELFKGCSAKKTQEYCGKKQYGFIAQDLQEVFPELVEKDSATGYLGVQYTNLIAVLVDAINLQQAQFDSLKTQLNNCCCNTTKSSTNRTLTNAGIVSNTNLTDAKLYQNTPNPFTQTTVVKCFVPQSSQSASLLVFDMNGSLKKTIAISSKGEVNTTINGRELVSGMYYYTLLIDGQEVDTKKMILTE